MSRPRKNTVHWFRKGLRLHDNPALREGIQDSFSYRCIYILDPWFAGASQVGINKWRLVELKIFFALDYDKQETRIHLPPTVIAYIYIYEPGQCQPHEY